MLSRGKIYWLVEVAVLVADVVTGAVDVAGAGEETYVEVAAVGVGVDVGACSGTGDGTGGGGVLAG